MTFTPFSAKFDYCPLTIPQPDSPAKEGALYPATSKNSGRTIKRRTLIKDSGTKRRALIASFPDGHVLTPQLMVESSPEIWQGKTATRKQNSACQFLSRSAIKEGLVKKSGRGKYEKLAATKDNATPIKKKASKKEDKGSNGPTLNGFSADQKRVKQFLQSILEKSSSPISAMDTGSLGHEIISVLQTSHDWPEMPSRSINANYNRVFATIAEHHPHLVKRHVVTFKTDTSRYTLTAEGLKFIEQELPSKYLEDPDLELLKFIEKNFFYSRFTTDLLTKSLAKHSQNGLNLFSRLEILVQTKNLEKHHRNAHVDTYQIPRTVLRDRIKDLEKEVANHEDGTSAIKALEDAEARIGELEEELRKATQSPETQSTGQFVTTEQLQHGLTAVYRELRKEISEGRIELLEKVEDAINGETPDWLKQEVATHKSK